jgi:ATP-dependent DNA ligase
VILGYQLDKEGRLSALVLGTHHLGNLVHAGSVTPKMSETERAELVQMLAAIRTHEPLVYIESDRTYWVKPKYACRVKYVHKEKGRLIDIEWDKMLGAIQVQRPSEAR